MRTIPQVNFVNDSGYQKTVPYEKIDNFSIGLTSKLNCIQRWGRTGRVSNGQSLLILTKEQFNQLRNQPNPQILEHDLKDFIIHMKSLDIDFEDLDLFAKPGN